jgi:hypothetical protein
LSPVDISNITAHSEIQASGTKGDLKQDINVKKKYMASQNAFIA